MNNINEFENTLKKLEKYFGKININHIINPDYYNNFTNGEKIIIELRKHLEQNIY